IEEHLSQLGRNRADLAGAYSASVDLAYRRNFRRGAREERLVGNVEVVARDALRAHAVARVLRERDHGLACDGDQRTRELRLVDLAILYHEQIFTGALGNETVDIQQQSFVVTVFGRFKVREYGIRIRARILGAAHRDVDVMPSIRRCLDAYAFFE